ncbi:MAG: hypothetical protein CL843_17845 [Crocinitomicaceae bacterium]|nr:hypothetical protein [Crocinitomicaceae bacterium]
MISRFLSEISSLSFKGLAPMLSKIIGMGAGYFNIWIITKYYGLEAQGAFSFLTTVINLTALFSMTGMDTFLLKQASIYHAGEKQKEYTGLLLRVVLMGVFQAAIAGGLFFLFSGQLAAFYEAPNYSIAFKIFAFGIPFYVAFYLLNEAQRTRNNNLLYSMGNHAYGVFVLLLLSAALLFDIKGELIPVWSYIAAAILLFIVMLVTSFNVLVRPRVFSLSQRQIRKMAWPFFMISSVSLLLNWTDVLMLRWLTNEAELGAYHIIFRLGLLVTLPLTVLNTILPAKFAGLRLKKEKKELQQLITTSLRFSTAGSLVIFGGLVLVMSLVFDLLEVNDYPHLWEGTFILGLGHLIAAFFGPNGSFLLMADSEKKYTVILGITAVLNIVLNFMLIPQYGFIGATIATAISVVVRNLWAVASIKKTHQLKFWIH